MKPDNNERILMKEIWDILEGNARECINKQALETCLKAILKVPIQQNQNYSSIENRKFIDNDLFISKTTRNPEVEKEEKQENLSEKGENSDIEESTLEKPPQAEKRKIGKLTIKGRLKYNRIF